MRASNSASTVWLSPLRKALAARTSAAYSAGLIKPTHGPLQRLI